MTTRIIQRRASGPGTLGSDITAPPIWRMILRFYVREYMKRRKRLQSEDREGILKA
jgi:hypothetical protein